MSRPVIGLNTNFIQFDKYWQYHVRDTYVDAVSNHGGLPLPIPCTPDEDALRQYLSMLDGLILIGGRDYPSEWYGEAPVPELDVTHPRRAEADIALARLALKTDLPILGICAGAQLLNVATGGKLIQHLPQAEDHLHENYHEVEILGGKWLPRIFSESRIITNSNHHQALSPQALGSGLEIVARCGDVIEAVEMQGERFVLGLQWHPERINDPEHRRRIFEFFIEHSRKAGK